MHHSNGYVRIYTSNFLSDDLLGGFHGFAIPNVHSQASTEDFIALDKTKQNMIDMFRT